MNRECRRIPDCQIPHWRLRGRRRRYGKEFQGEYLVESAVVSRFAANVDGVGGVIILAAVPHRVRTVCGEKKAENIKHKNGRQKNAPLLKCIEERKTELKRKKHDSGKIVLSQKIDLLRKAPPSLGASNGRNSGLKRRPSD